MCKVQMLRALVKQRLTAAAEEIFGLFERTIAEYEEKLSASKEENERQRRLLDAVLHPQLRLHRADVQQLLVVKKAVPPEQLDRDCGLDQKDPEPPHVKEEQEEICTSQEGEQLQGLEEADIKFTFTPVKSEDDEGEDQSSQLHQRQNEQKETEADAAYCGGSVPDKKLHPERHSGPDTDEAEDVSESETDDSRDWKETHEPQSDLNPLQNKKVPVSDVNCSTGNTSVSSDNKVRLKKYTGAKTGEKPFSCSRCSETFLQKGNLQRHMTVHTEEKAFRCSVCRKTFARKGTLKLHIAIHTGVKPISCSMCSKTFLHKAYLNHHMIIHKGVKPFSCSVCSKTFAQKRYLKHHLTIHTGVKPFSCSVCSKTFAQKKSLNYHMTSHTTVTPFSCSMCCKKFSRKAHLKHHMTIHTKKSL